ncbi:MAG TPA: antibiotic biosynthesis monooxygenase [Burkholderiaceae bacterium]|nr:antibiotic biosynthesis monooxygenase [Burkholderiaceae bacterium]
MIVTVFRARVRAGADMAALGAVGERMYALATAMPGFVSYKDYAAADGESVTVVEFASEPELLAWRNHPEHRDAQERGRREFFAEYTIQVCRVERGYTFTEAAGRSELR